MSPDREVPSFKLPRTADASTYDRERGIELRLLSFVVLIISEILVARLARPVSDPADPYDTA